MQYTLFGAIDIGSSEMELKIFELSRGKGMREIDCIRNRLELGKDTYATGKISTEKLEELCLVLNDFISIMKSYKVEAYRAYTTSAIREAKNRVILLDYLEKKTGLKIEVLDNAEQRFLDYKSIAAQANEFNRIIEKGTAILDVGGGSVQVSLFDKDSLVSTQNIRIGNLRIRERVAAMEHMYGHFEELVQELTRSELQNFKKMYVKDREVSNVILVGDYLGGLSKKQSVSLEEFQTIYDGVVHVEPSVAAERFELPEESISLIVPTLIICSEFISAMGAESIWMPGLNLNDGNAYDYAQRKRIIRAGHNFDEDILASARNIAKRYQCRKSHIRIMENLGLQIFDRMKKIHGLGSRERLLLQIAVILHGCGKYISLSDPADCSYQIIMATEIIGLSRKEREIIAYIVKFNTTEFPYYEELSRETDLDRSEYLTVAKLAAILRVANACDRSHKQKFENVKVSLKDKELIIQVDTPEDITLERGLFTEKAAFFEEVFSIRTSIHQKKHI